MCVCNWRCKAFGLERNAEMQLGFRMDLAQTAIGSSQGIKAVRRCTGRHSLLYQYSDYAGDGVCVCSWAFW